MTRQLCDRSVCGVSVPGAQLQMTDSALSGVSLSGDGKLNPHANASLRKAPSRAGLHAKMHWMVVF